MKKISIILTSFLFFFPILVYSAEQETADFTLEDIDGNIFSLKEHLGKGPILIDFWATWCSPCKLELPLLQKIYDKYKAQGFLLITIAIDSPKSQSKVKPYVISKKFTFLTLLDPDSEILKFFQGNSVPYQVIIDKEGTVIETHEGYTPGDEKVLEEKIGKLLKSEHIDD
jgi:thiol-disulfide isomerase/thioredoxin